jgi:hypothetical protein
MTLPAHGEANMRQRMVMVADFRAAHAAEKFLCPICASTIKAIGFLVVDPPDLVTLVQSFHDPASSAFMIVPLATWAGQAAAFLKHKLRVGDVTYAELANRIKSTGLKRKPKPASPTSSNEGRFPATWFLAVIAALDLDGVALEEI